MYPYNWVNLLASDDVFFLNYLKNQILIQIPSIFIKKQAMDISSKQYLDKKSYKSVQIFFILRKFKLMHSIFL